MPPASSGGGGVGPSDFRVLKRLGSGAFGEVMLAARKRDASQCVIKAVTVVGNGVSRKEQEQALNEVRVLSKVEHPHVVRYLASYVSNEKLHIVMEWCEGGDLRKAIDGRKDALGPIAGAFPEATIWRYLSHIFSGLAHLHSLKVLHRDMKSSNLFLKRGVVVLGDLGCARLLGATAELATTFVGTPYYLSPELCNNESYGPASDVWAAGVVAFELLSCGSYPFTANHAPALIVRILRGHPDAPPEHYSADLRERVVDACLRQDPKLRPTASGLLEVPQIRRWRETDAADAAAADAAAASRQAPPQRTPPPPMRSTKLLASPGGAASPTSPLSPQVPAAAVAGGGAATKASMPPVAPPISPPERERQAVAAVARAAREPRPDGYAAKAAARAAAAKAKAAASPSVLQPMARRKNGAMGLPGVAAKPLANGNRVRRAGPMPAPRADAINGVGPSAARRGIHDERRRAEERKRWEAARLRQEASAKEAAELVTAALAAHEARLADAATDDDDDDDDTDGGSGGGGGNGIHDGGRHASAANGGRPGVGALRALEEAAARDAVDIGSPGSPSAFGALSSPWLPLPTDDGDGGRSNDDGDDGSGTDGCEQDEGVDEDPFADTLLEGEDVESDGGGGGGAASKYIVMDDDGDDDDDSEDARHGLNAAKAARDDADDLDYCEGHHDRSHQEEEETLDDTLPLEDAFFSIVPNPATAGGAASNRPSTATTVGWRIADA